MAVVTPADAWIEVDGTHQLGPYTIEPDAESGRGWVVSVDPRFPRVPWRLGHHAHSRLSGAKAWAMHHRLSVVRRIKLIRHVALFVVFSLVGATAWQALAVVQGESTVFVFAVAALSLSLALRELVGVVNHVIGDGPSFEMGSDTAVDRAVTSSLARLQTQAGADEADEDPVRIVEI